MGLKREFFMTYFAEGRKKELHLPFHDDWFPVGPIILAMGMQPKQAMRRVKAYPNEEVLVDGWGRGKKVVCMRPPHIDQWLLGLNPARYSNPELVAYFQKFLVRGLNDFLEEVKADEEKRRRLAEVKPMAPDKDIEYLSWQQAMEAQGLKECIYIDRPLTKQQRFRLYLNQMGLTNWDYINFAVDTRDGIDLARIKPGTEDEVEFSFCPSFCVHRGAAESHRRSGWDVEPVFYEKYPLLYERLYEYIWRAREGDHFPEMVVVGSGYRPWHSIEAVTKYTNLQKEVRERLLEQRRKEVMAELKARLEAAKQEEDTGEQDVQASKDDAGVVEHT